MCSFSDKEHMLDFSSSKRKAIYRNTLTVPSKLSHLMTGYITSFLFIQQTINFNDQCLKMAWYWLTTLSWFPWTNDFNAPYNFFIRRPLITVSRTSCPAVVLRPFRNLSATFIDIDLTPQGTIYLSFYALDLMSPDIIHTLRICHCLHISDVQIRASERCRCVPHIRHNKGKQCHRANNQFEFFHCF